MVFNVHLPDSSQLATRQVQLPDVRNGGETELLREQLFRIILKYFLIITLPANFLEDWFEATVF